MNCGPVPDGVAIERNAQLEVSAVELAVAPWTRVAFGYDADGLLTAAGELTFTRRADNGRLESTRVGVVTDSRTVTSFGELDIELMNDLDSGIVEVEWHFFPSERGFGPTPALHEALDRAGISIVLHPIN